MADKYDSNICAICQDLLFQPTILDPCQHIYCETCLRRLGYAEINTCPLCRNDIQGCYPLIELCKSLKTKFPDQFKSRQLNENKSKDYLLPLPPILNTDQKCQNWIQYQANS